MRIAHNRLTNQEFITKANKKHHHKYDYSRCEYNGYDSIVEIICPQHGSFQQRASDHLQGGCYKCGRDNIQHKLTSSRSLFISKARKVHGSTYDYSSAVYVNSVTKINIRCAKHGEFWQTPNNHLNNGGHGCEKCFRESRFSNTSDFIRKAKEINGELYDYRSVEYVKVDQKVKIICRKHGEFEQSPECHLAGKGCQRCIRKQEYKLEIELRKTFTGFAVLTQKAIFSNAHNRTRYFDFILEKEKRCFIVEYDGKQHFQPIRFNYAMTREKAEAKFKKQQETDRLDAEFCKQINVPLFRVKYNDNIPFAVSQIQNQIEEFMVNKYADVCNQKR